MTPRTMPAIPAIPNIAALKLSFILSFGLINPLVASANNHNEVTASQPAPLCNIRHDAGLASHFMLLRLCRLDQQPRDTASAPLAPARPHA